MWKAVILEDGWLPDGGAGKGVDASFRESSHNSHIEHITS
jgi:hypothetical protein